MLMAAQGQGAALERTCRPPIVFYWDSVPNPDTPCGLSSSTYLQEQIPGPGRSSDDDLLNSAGAPAVTATISLYLSDE